jgi:class 3 adenylate cyclase/tetratricopeptide (TPR) repeat protein
MKCPRCQHENKTGAKFCEECAAPLARACVNCGEQLSPTAKFCPECAHPTGLSGAPPAAPQFASPQSYTPRHLAEKILTSRNALEGERKQVTVLFADLKGSMELLADRDPEEARKILDPVLERMMEAVHHYEGTVNQVMGDGIMALFGAPVTHEDHAVRACYAALRMQRRVALHADEIQRAGGTPVQIRVGLNSGEVVVRAIGNDLHMDYTAVGQTTHLAARTEQLAKPGSALATGATLKLAEGYVEGRPLGAVAVKGLETPIPVFELTAIVPARSRLQASAARGLSRFVGRDRELEELTQALDRAAAGHGQAVAVVGEAGLGKSRLVWEFTRSRRTHSWLVLGSGSVSYGKATPYLPVIDLLKAYCRIQERDDQREVRERVAGKLLTLDRTLEPLLPPLLALLDLPADDPAWADLDPPQRRQRTLEAVKRLLLRESQVQPLLVLFEDLHWIDAETQALLDSLMESLPTARLLLLVNYRPEYQHAWASKSYYRQLRIDPLPLASAEALLDTLLGEDPALAPLKRLLIVRTEGNPFFLEESVQTLVESGVLVGTPGSYRPTKAPEFLQIPATVHATLAARIDRLAPETKRLLQAAAVIGKDVPFPLLQAIADMPEDDLRRGLGHLQAAEFLHETSLFPDLEYTFKHALTQEVTYSSLLHDPRRILHGQIVEAIERLYADRLPEHIERVAHHALRGDLWEKAVTYLRQAGAKANTRSSNREALAYFEQALTAVGHLVQSRTSLERTIDLHLDLRAPLIALGQFDGVRTCLDHAERLARALDDSGRLGWVSAYLGHYFWIIGQPAASRAFSERALEIAKAIGDSPLEILPNMYLAYLCGASGEHRQAADHCRTMIQLTEGDLGRKRIGSTFPSVISRGWLAYTLADLGEFEEGIARGREGLRMGEALGQPFSVAHCHWGLGYLHAVKGDLSEAVHLLETGLALCRECDVVLMVSVLASGLGWAYAVSGRLDEGLLLAGEGLTGFAKLGFHPMEALGAVQSAAALGLANRLNEARAVAERALALARARSQRGFEAEALRLLGDIAARSEPQRARAAEDHHREAMALAEELGMRPLVAHCHLGLGKLYWRTGKREQAQEYLTTATTMYRDMGMTYWLERLESEVPRVE